MSQHPSSRVKLVSNIKQVIQKSINKLPMKQLIILTCVLVIVDFYSQSLEINQLVAVLILTLETNPILSNIKNESTVKRPNSSTKRHRPIPPATLPKLAKFH